MATMEELNSVVDQLKRRLKDMEMERQEEKKHGTTNVVVHTTQDKKMTKFSETDDVDDWCEKARNHPPLKNLTTEREKVNFIMDHLTENPRRTLKLQIDQSKATLQEVCQILKDVYGNKKSLFQMQTDFFKTEQGDNTIEEFAQIIMMKLLVLKRKDPATYKDTDAILKDRFAEGLQTVSLKREMKRLNREQSEMKFHDLRHLAETWMNDNEENVSTSESVAMFAQVLSKQQDQLDSLSGNIQSIQTNHVQQQQHHHSQNNPPFYHNQPQRFDQPHFRGRGQPRGRGYHTGYQPQHNHAQPPGQFGRNSFNDGPQQLRFPRTIYCHYCQQPNHIVRDCVLKKQHEHNKHTYNYTTQPPGNIEQQHSSQQPLNQQASNLNHS